MKFDVYFPFTNKAGAKCPGIKPHQYDGGAVLLLIGSKEHIEKVNKVRNAPDKKAYEEAKKDLPAI